MEFKSEEQYLNLLKKALSFSLWPEPPIDFEKLYEQGTIEENDTWKDYQRFDHLFYKQEILETFLRQLA